MTCAVSAAVREGAEAVICASTGNTAASAAAYAARAGLTRRGDRARGQDRHGQAGAGADARRARDRAARQLRPGARRSCASSRDRHPIALVNSRQPVPPRGPEDGGVRDPRGARRTRSTRSASRSATPGNITAYWRGFQRGRRGAADARLPGRGRGAAGRRRARSSNPETVASAIRIGNPARWEEAMAAMTESRGAIRGRHRRGDPRRLPLARRRAKALLRAGLGRLGRRAAEARRRRRRADRLRAHRPRPEGPADRARAGGLGGAVRARARRGRARRARGRRGLCWRAGPVGGCPPDSQVPPS